MNFKNTEIEYDDDLKPIDMQPLFYPKTMAVIGVSQNKIGGIKYVIANDVSGYMQAGGKVYPINPKYKELYGYKVYPSLFDPEVPNIDLAIIAVPAAAVPDVVRDCGKKRVKFAVIFSSGFAESGNFDLQKKLEDAIEEAKRYTRFIGPNCLGINNPYSHVSYYPGMASAPGNVSYVSMSGGNTGRLTTWLVTQGMGINNAVSIGNSIDLTATDFINYFREDPKTKVIALYLESVPNGRKFMKALKAATLKKPVVLWKGGQTEVGQKATVSHTGGLAGSYEIWKSMAYQTGSFLADYFEMFADFVTCLSLDYYLPNDENVAILVCGGGISVEYADMCIKAGLKVPELSKETQNKLAEVFPSVNVSFRNPLDLGEYGYVPHYFDKALRIVAKDPNISSILYVREAERFILFQDVIGIPNMDQLTIKLLIESSKIIKKPLFCSMSPNGQELEHYEPRFNFKVAMLKNNLAVVDLVPHACELIKQMVRYKRYLDAHKNNSSKY